MAIVVTLVRLSGSFVVTYDLAGGTMEETETRVWLDSEYVLPIPSKRGYAFATVNNKVIKEVNDVNVNETIKLSLQDGNINALVMSKEAK